MNGYDEMSGIYRLSGKKMREWLRVKKDRTIKERTLPGYCAELFRRAGIMVVRIRRTSIDVVADGAEVWSVLSGEPASFGHANPPAAKVYEKWIAVHAWLTPTELGKRFSPPIRHDRTDDILERLGFQRRVGDAWLPTEAASGLCKSGEIGRGKKKQPVLFWRPHILDKIAPLLEVEYQALTAARELREAQPKHIWRFSGEDEGSTPYVNLPEASEEGYDASTGIFTLTKQRMREWTRPAPGLKINGQTGSKYCAQVLRDAGHIVLRVDEKSLDVVGCAAGVFAALSGVPATAGRSHPPAEDVYHRWISTNAWFTLAELGNHFSPPINEATVFGLLKRFGFVGKVGMAWEPTTKATGYWKIDYRVAKRGSAPELMQLWRPQMLDALASKLEEAYREHDARMASSDKSDGPPGR